MSDVTRGRKKLVAKSFCRYGSGVISYLEPLVMKCDRYHFPKIDKDCPLRKCGAVFFCPCDNPFDIRDYYLSVADTHEWEDYGLAHMWSIYTDRWFAFLQRLRPEYLLMLTDTISTDFWMRKLAKMDLNDMAYTPTNKPLPLFLRTSQTRFSLSRPCTPRIRFSLSRSACIRARSGWSLRSHGRRTGRWSGR